MEVEAYLESPRANAGDKAVFGIQFTPHDSADNVLILGFAVVQGFFKLGDMILSEPFEGTRNSGIVIGQHGFEYSNHGKSSGIFSGVLDGFKQLVVDKPGPQHADDWGDYPIFSTSQLLLFPELKLNKPQKFRISVDLPENLPSTYKSKSLSIGYNLVLGFQRPQLNQKPMETKLFLPFKVQAKSPSSAYPNPLIYDLRYPIIADSPLLISEHEHASGHTGEHSNEHERHTGERTNEHTGEQTGEHKYMTDFINKLMLNESNNNDTEEDDFREDLVPGSNFSKVHFELNKNGTLLASLDLARPAVKIGDILTAQVKFHRPCLHLSAYIELKEEIFEPYAALGAQDQVSDTQSSCVYTVFSRQYMQTFGLKEMALYFPTLTSATPRLDTQQLRSSWTLKLEFVGLAGTAFAESEQETECLEGIGQVDCEVFTCRIPVQILPSDPVGLLAHKIWRF